MMSSASVASQQANKGGGSGKNIPSSQADMLASAAAAAQAKQGRRERRLGSRLRRARQSTRPVSGGNGESWTEVQVAERDARIHSLEREVEASADTIKALRSDLVQLRATFKDEEYHAQKKIEFLQENNAAYAVKIAQFEGKLFKISVEGENDGNGGEAEGEDGTGSPSLGPGECNTVSLDAAYVALLRNHVEESKKQIKLMEEVLARQVEESGKVEHKLRDEIKMLKAEREKQNLSFSALSDKFKILNEEKHSEIEDLHAKLECRDNTLRSLSQKVMIGLERSEADEVHGKYFEELKNDLEYLKCRFEEANLSSMLKDEDAEARQEERLVRDLY